MSSQFYPAVIDAIAQDGSTVVVTFTEYGNQEEVFVEDIQPTHQSGWVCWFSSVLDSLARGHVINIVFMVSYLVQRREVRD